MTQGLPLRSIGVALAAGLAASSAHALDPTLAVTQYVQSAWRAPRDLPHDNVTAIVQTLYAAKQGGRNRVEAVV